MNDDATDESNAEGKEVDKPVEDISELDKLKAHNAELEKELIKGRELKAEAQKLEAEKMVGGQSDAGQETEVKKEETPHEYHERIKKEMSEGKTDFGN